MNPNSSLAKTKNHVLRPACFALGLSLLAGCVVEARPRRVYVEPAPAVVVVREAPPPLRQEYVPYSPGPGYIWCPGHWRYNGGYYWVAGRWAAPPRGYGRWVAPHWEVRGGGYFFVEGVWR